GTVSYKVSGTNGIMNINTGEVTISTTVSGNNVKITQTLKLKKEKYLDSTSTLEIGEGATLDFQNGETGTVEAGVAQITAATWNLKLDVNIDELKADNLNVINTVAVTSQAIITDINFIGENTNIKAENTVKITTSNSINALVNPNIYSINGINYQVIARNVDGEGTYLDIVAYGYGGLAIAVYDGAPTYEVKVDSTGKDYVTAWIEDPVGTPNNFLKADLVIKGSEGNSVLTSTTSLSGINTETHKLTIQDLTEYSGFNNALTVATSGELVLSTVTFTNNSGEAVITNEGTANLSNVTFSENDADIDVSNSGTLNITGEGKTTTLEKGISGTGTTIVASGAELVNGSQSTIKQTELTNSGTVSNAGTVNATTLTNNADATITNSGTITGTDNTINNSGTIANSGTINATATLSNTGTITNAGSVTAGTLTNNANATITNEAGKTITATEVTNSGTVSNAGTVNATTLTNNADATITNEGTISSVNTITNKGILTSKAENIKITGTTKTIINDGGTYNINGGTLNGYNVIGTSVDSSKINIKDNVTIAAGKTIINNTVTLGNGNDDITLKLEEESSLNTSMLEITKGSTLDIQNGETGIVNAGIKITENGSWNLKLDIDLAEQKSDTLNVISVADGSQAIVNGINLLSDRGQAKVQISGLNINATPNPDEYDSVYTTNLKYKVTAENGENGTYLILTAEGYGGLPIAVYDGATSYSVTEDIDKVQGWIDEHNYLMADLAINGNNKTIKAEPGSGTLEGMIISDDTKLTMNKLASFEGFDNALTVNANGELIVSSVTFTNNTGEAVIKNAGTTNLTNVTFSENSADIIDVANNGTLNIKADGEAKTTTLEKGINGTGTTTVESGAELVNGSQSTIKQTEVTNSGTVSNAGTVEATTLTNNATITNSGTITGTDNTITNKGEITNSGTISAKTIGNEANATITNEEGKTITATTVENAGIVENAGSVTVTDLSNSGTIANAGTVETTTLTNNAT
ncbi:MAG: hypothetical protein IKN42_02615, partial [Elusimicrobia bacterium]|nr:hypothetical protein [Elusimicrobiota bacterium]